jgi:type IV pilus assembly protein PilC
MIDAGLPIVQCLTILSEQSDSRVLRSVTATIARDVQGGSTLADAYRKHPRTFSDLYVNMLQAGEAAGILDIVLQRLATYIEKAASLKRKVKSAMVYPTTIISIAILVIIFMMTFVIPTFSKMFAQLGAELPMPTQIVLAMSDFTQRYVLLIVAGLAGFAFGFRALYRTDRGSRFIDPLLLKIPVVGMLIRKVSVARFTRTLGTLVVAGVPTLEGLRITARSAGNRAVEMAVMRARDAVTAGRPLSEPLRDAPVFPSMVVHMISVGESTGSLDQMLSKIADFYDDEVDGAVSALMSLLEPVMIVILGVIIGGLVIALYLPIFKIVTLIK